MLNARLRSDKYQFLTSLVSLSQGLKTARFGFKPTTCEFPDLPEWEAGALLIQPSWLVWTALIHWNLLVSRRCMFVALIDSFVVQTESTLSPALSHGWRASICRPLRFEIRNTPPAHQSVTGSRITQSGGSIHPARLLLILALLSQCDYLWYYSQTVSVTSPDISTRQYVTTCDIIDWLIGGFFTPCRQYRSYSQR